jgi:hypothetical protein
LQYNSIISAIKIMKASQRIQNDKNDIPTDPKYDSRLSLNEFIQLTEESLVVSKLLKSLLHLSGNDEVRARVNSK